MLNTNLNNIVKGMFIGENLHPKYGQYEELVIPASIFTYDTLINVN